MRRWLVRLAALSVALLAARPAAAIVDGVPDGTAHPHVGLVVFYEGGEPLHRCTGTLLSPTVLLTAAHCTEGTTRAQVWFDPQVTRASGYPLTGGVTGTPYTHPGYDFPENDVGIVVLDQPVYPGIYGVLPPLGLLDALATQRGPRPQQFTVVGYGHQQVLPTAQEETIRYRATVQLIDLHGARIRDFGLLLTNNPGTGGGICFGDSGGPVFLDDTNMVVGITSFGRGANCLGINGAQRTDTPSAQSFVRSFLN